MEISYERYNLLLLLGYNLGEKSKYFFFSTRYFLVTNEKATHELVNFRGNSYYPLFATSVTVYKSHNWFKQELPFEANCH